MSFSLKEFLRRPLVRIPAITLYSFTIPGDGPPDEGAQDGDGWRTRTKACFRAAQERMMLPPVFLKSSCCGLAIEEGIRSEVRRSMFC